MIAHVGGLPIEEVMPALMSGVGAWVILWLSWLAARVPRVGERTRTHRGRDSQQSTKEVRSI